MKTLKFTNVLLLVLVVVAVATVSYKYFSQKAENEKTEEQK